MKVKLALLGAVVAALATAAPAAAFTPTNTYYAKQWYLASDHAFSAWQTPPSNLAPVKIAVVDSGVDCSLPDFAGRIAMRRSFVGGSACSDDVGHGTIVAGEIAGDLGSNGVVGIAYSSKLLVAKVVRTDGTIGLTAEADAIKWAANHGARVINLSLGGVRDPRDPRIDSYSKLEASAVAYAYAKGAVVVAAVGNADEANALTWPFADYPAALPHVLGVAALDQKGNVPGFSDYDPRYVDIAAPGVDTFSTFPTALTAQQRPGCVPQGYTDCAGTDYVHPEGTSFAAPQVSAAAAVLFALDPSLTNSQVTAILEQTADDVDAATGCSLCRVGRDPYSGWGQLDVARAVAKVNAGALPVADRFESNDDAPQAFSVGGRRSIKATIDYYDDPWDVYKVKLAKGQKITLRSSAKWPATKVGLLLWRPGTRTVLRGALWRERVASSLHAGSVEKIVYRAARPGWYYVEVKAGVGGSGTYTLKLTKTKPPKPKPKRA